MRLLDARIASRSLGRDVHRVRARRAAACSRHGSTASACRSRRGATYMRVDEARADRPTPTADGAPDRTVLHPARRQRLAPGRRRRARRRAAPPRREPGAAQGDDARHSRATRAGTATRSTPATPRGPRRRPTTSAASSACRCRTSSTSTSPASRASSTGSAASTSTCRSTMHDTYSGAYFSPGRAAHERRRRRWRSRATATTSRRATSSARTTRAC